MRKKSFYQQGELGRTENWIWVSGLCIILAAYFLPDQFLRSTAYFIQIKLFGSDLRPLEPHMVYDIITLVYSWSLPLILSLVAIRYVQRNLRDQTLKGLVTTAPRFRFKRAFMAGLIFLGLQIVFILFRLFLLSGDNLSLFSDRNFTDLLNMEFSGQPILKITIAWAFLIFLVPLWAFFEEIFFRGFLGQGLIKILGDKHLAFFCVSLFVVIWGIGSEYYFSRPPYFIFYLFLFSYVMLILTDIDGGIEAAVGINFIAIALSVFFVDFRTHFTMITSLFIYNHGAADMGIFVQEIFILLSTLLILMRWNIGKKVIQPVSENQETAHG